VFNGAGLSTHALVKQSRVQWSVFVSPIGEHFSLSDVTYAYHKTTIIYIKKLTGFVVLLTVHLSVILVINQLKT